MKNILFVTMHRPKRSPGQRFRFEQYIPHLTQNGYKCDISYIISEKDDSVIYAPGRYAEKFWIFTKSVLTRLRDVIAARNYQIVFVFREALMVNSGVIEALLARTGARLIFDFDDAIWLQGVSESNRRLAWLRSGSSKFPGILRRMDLVLAGNAYLADYARQFNSNVHVMPTTLDVDTHAPRERPPQAALCIGWSGSPSTVPYFDQLTPVLHKVKQAFGDKIYFKVIGDGAYRHPGLGIVGIPWREDREVEETAELDIGLMPLPDDPWTQGKCGFKALLYMSMAIPPIVSPVGVNTTIISHGVNGYLAEDDEAWISSLASLLTAPQLRLRLGREGRKTVVERYSLQSQRSRYLSLIDQLS